MGLDLLLILPVVSQLMHRARSLPPDSATLIQRGNQPKLNACPVRR
jgi:hypothetical protein